MKRKNKPVARRSPCPVAATLDLIGDKWTLLVIRDLYAGKRRFIDIALSPERIATNILAARLERLQASGLIAAEASPDRAGSSEYTLTLRGRSLLPLLVAMRDWGLANISGTAAKINVPSGPCPVGLLRSELVTSQLPGGISPGISDPSPSPPT